MSKVRVYWVCNTILFCVSIILTVSVAMISITQNEKVVVAVPLCVMALVAAGGLFFSAYCLKKVDASEDAINAAKAQHCEDERLLASQASSLQSLTERTSQQGAENSHLIRANRELEEALDGETDKVYLLEGRLAASRAEVSTLTATLERLRGALGRTSLVPPRAPPAVAASHTSITVGGTPAELDALQTVEMPQEVALAALQASLPPRVRARVSSGIMPSVEAVQTAQLNGASFTQALGKLKGGENK